MSWSPRCYIPSFLKIGPPVLEKILKGFDHIWAWRPSWSCDPDAANKISFPLPKEAPHKIWLWSAQRFWRRRCLKLWTTPTTTPEHWYTISSPMSLWLRWAKNAWTLIWESLFLCKHTKALMFSLFSVCCLDSAIHEPYISKFSSLNLVSVAEQASSCLTWFQTSRNKFI